MKKLLLVLTILPFMISCNGQNKELQNEIELQIKEIEDLIELSLIKVSVDPIPENQLSSDISAFTVKNTSNSSFFDSLEIDRTNLYPHSYFMIDFDEYHFTNSSGYDNSYFSENPNRKPKFEITKVIYADGTTQDAKTSILPESEARKIDYFEDEKVEKEEDRMISRMLDSGLYFFQNNSKPVIGVEVKVLTNFPNTKDYVVEKNQETIKTNYGNIEILEFKGNEFTYKAPEALAGKIEVNALYKNGKYLTVKGSQNFESTHEVKKLENVIKALNKAKSKVSKGEINTKKEVENFLQSENIDSNLSTDNFITHSDYFSSTISKIIISVVGEDKPTERLHTYYISKFLRNRYKQTGYAICEDAQTKKKGIIDLRGEWLIKPIYHDISQTNFIDKHFVEVALNKNEGTYSLYWINEINKQLLKTDYELIGYSLRDDNPNLVIVGKTIQGIQKLGVANRATGKLLIPLEYEYITFLKGNIICDIPNQKKAKIFNENGVQIAIKQK